MDTVTRAVRKAVRRRSGGVRADLVIVANRLPVDRVVHADGSTTWRRSPGGLVSALAPVMAANEGAWIGWPGDVVEDLDVFEHDPLLVRRLRRLRATRQRQRSARRLGFEL